MSSVGPLSTTKEDCEDDKAGEITQVLDAIPWVRCASGNVCDFVRILEI